MIEMKNGYPPIALPVNKLKIVIWNEKHSSILTERLTNSQCYAMYLSPFDESNAPRNIYFTDLCSGTKFIQALKCLLFVAYQTQHSYSL